MKNPLISIIVPVYNMEKYLEKCIESVIEQTFQDIEIVVVNDGSRDTSLQILRRFAAKDQRIKIVDQVNQGLSGARNSGIDQATAPYIMFLDGDDWIDPQTCEEAYKAIEKNNADVVMWTYVREYETKSLPRKIFNGNMIFEGENARSLHRRLIGPIGKELCNPEDFESIVTAWGKLYKKSIIKENNIKFIDLKEIGTWEDGLFNTTYFGFIKKAVFIDEPYNHYLKTNNTALTKTYKSKFNETYINLFSRIETYINDNNLDASYLEALNNRRAMSIIHLALNECSNGNKKTHKEIIKFIKDINNENEYRTSYKKLIIKHFPLHWKIFFMCAKYNCSIGVYTLAKIISYIIARRNK